MKKPMHHITFKNPKHWSTHMPMLIRAMELTEGTVVEVGGGVFSTPLLHWLCKMQGRRLITYENEPQFVAFSNEFRSTTHSIRLINDWDEMDFKSKRGVVFIDHHPEFRRGLDAIRFKDSAQIVVMHDVERPDKYSYHGVWPHFKSSFIYKDCRPWTGAASNFIDLSKMFPNV